MAADYTVDGLIYRSPDTLGTLIAVQPSLGKGLGLFALRSLPAGTLLLSERPLVVLADDGARADPLDALVSALPPPQKTAYRSLHGYQQEVVIAAAPTAATAPTPSSCRQQQQQHHHHHHHHAPPRRESLNRRVLYSNGFATGPTTTAVFALASRINHSCAPNARFAWDAPAGRMAFIACAALRAGEEVTVDYGHGRGHLKKYYGFECECGACIERGSVSTEDTAAGGGGGGEGGGVRLVQDGGQEQEDLKPDKQVLGRAPGFQATKA